MRLNSKSEHTIPKLGNKLEIRKGYMNNSKRKEKIKQKRGNTQLNI